MSHESYAAEYISKLAPVSQALSILQSGDSFATSVCALEPNLFLDNLHTLHGKASGLTMVDGLTMNHHPYLEPKYKGLVDVESFFFMSPARRAAREGMVSFIPGHLHASVERWLSNRKLKAFVAMASPMDKNGYFWISLSQIHERIALEHAEIVILEVNPNVPRVFGTTEVHISQVDMIIESSTPLPELPRSAPTPVEEEIGRHVASLINDGDTIQLGIGGIPDAIAKNLMSKHDLGVHTEMINNGMMDLINAGVITGRKKTLYNGKVVGVFALGEKALYDTLDLNPSVMMMRGDWANRPDVIAQNDNMVSVNSGLCVDLTGQICSESIGTNQYSGTGGQTDTASGAVHSKGGRSIIALPSTRKNGQLSSICSVLPLGSIVSLSRNEVDYVVTEYGIARLKGQSVKKRAMALIDIAHPDFRAELRHDAEKFLFI